MSAVRCARAVALIGVAAACSAPRAGADQVFDDCRTAGTPTRIVSLVPSATDLLVALGEGHRLAARTRYDRDPQLMRLPSVGGTIDPDLEAILAVGPDLILAWDDGAAPGLYRRLQRAGLHSEIIHATTLSDLRGTIRCLGVALSIQGKADSLVRRIEAGLDSVRDLHRGRGRVRVFYLVWPRPLITTAGGTFIDSMIAIAGGQNIFADLATPWPAVALENVIAREPELIIWPRHRSDREEVLANDPLWHGVRAARRGRVAIVDAELMARPGPRVVEGARELSRLIQQAARTP